MALDQEEPESMARFRSASGIKMGFVYLCFCSLNIVYIFVNVALISFIILNCYPLDLSQCVKNTNKFVFNLYTK